MTVRPGRRLWLAVSGAIILGFVVYWLVPGHDEELTRWNSGDPVTVIVIAANAEVVEVAELDGDWVWDVDPRSIPDTAVGSSIQGRLTGDCRCQLMTDKPRPVPARVQWMPVALGLLAVLSYWRSRRWRSLDEVVSMPPRTIRVEPVWMRHFVLSPRLGVRVVEMQDAFDVGAVIELYGTAAAWLPGPEAEVLLYGPHPVTGTIVLGSTAGRAIPSTAIKSSQILDRGIRPWSSHLADLIWEAPRHDGLLEIGGTDHQRLRLGSAHKSPNHGQRLLFAPRAVVTWAWAATYPGPFLLWMHAWASDWSPVETIAWMVIVFVVLQVVFDLVVRKSADREPLASWEDRSAAREAAAAAVALGYVTPVRLRDPS